MLRGEVRLALVCLGVWVCVPAAAEEVVDFSRDVRPILSDKCFTCHGPDEGTRLVDLRLDNREGAFAERPGGPVITPGDAAASRLYQRISHEKRALRMPPVGGGEPLTKEQVETVRRWIEQGAEWAGHWAYRPPRRSAPPATDSAWPRNGIDRFLLARLDREGLEPAPEADKPTLIRRVTLDLTGLPPTPEEVRAFVADRSPKAFEKVVERLLASPRYGERMAMEWLDLARYADTHGYHIDSHRDLWRWRDWVVEAFNANMPYDRFTIEQLAGDLLPNPTESQLIATGFNRNHMINYEGGAIAEEYQTEYVVDRVEATSTVWLGMTMGCARCHDHKYDPIEQRDFYRLFAFFNTIDEKGLDGRKGNAEPTLRLPSPEQRRQLDSLDRAIEAGEKAFPARKAERRQTKWRSTRLATMPKPPVDGLLAHYPMEGSLADASGGGRDGRKVRGGITWVTGRVGKGAEFSGEAHFRVDDAGDLDSGKPFSLALWARPSGKRSQSVLQKMAPKTRRGYQLEFSEFEPLPDLKRGQYVTFRMVHRWPDEAIEIRTRDLVVQDWWHIVVNYDGSGQAGGLELAINGRVVPVTVVKDRLREGVRNSAPLEFGSKEFDNPTKGRLDDLRIYDRRLAATEIEQLAIHEPMRAILSGLTPAPKKKTDRKGFEKRVRDYYMRWDAPAGLRKRYAKLEELKARRGELLKEIPTTMIMREMENPRPTHVLGRGNYRNPGEKVTPGVPSALPQLAAGEEANRLAFARWLVHPSHPLTARVTVNRFWQMYFGVGLVKTSEDFGSQGEAPSHPGLLDWLATEFIRTGWDVKAMQRLIVTSAGYRQSSRVTPELRERDPENRLIARGARFRLKAEIVRDNALAISGLLNGEMGGRAVYPYQPPGLWKEVAYGDYFTAQEFVPSHGPDLYRRGMYTFWKRTASPPGMTTFDAPDREKCVVRRARTNTPLQALVLLNGPTYVEAARALAQRMILEAGDDAASRIDFAWSLATARKPAAGERQLLRDLAERQLAHYARQPEAARRLIEVGESRSDKGVDAVELAAWTTVASAILNLDEVITKE